jgi:integrase
VTFKPGDKAKKIEGAQQLAAIKEPGRYRDHDVHGLYFQYSNADNRSWVLRYQIAGLKRVMGLGAYPEVGLAKARKDARDYRDMIRKGVDPLAARESAMEAVHAEKAARDAAKAKRRTFKEAADRYLELTAPGWKGDGQRKAFVSQMQRFAYPIIGSMDVAAIDTPDVLRVLEPIWQTKATVARLLRQRIERVLDWAKVSGHRTGDNPARLDGHLKLLLPMDKLVTAHHKALPFEQMPQFMAKLRAQDGVGARALELIILTAVRLQEGLNARWSELDLEAGVWTIPAPRMKRGKEGQPPHVVPLSDDAIALLQTLRETPGAAASPFVFPGRARGKPISYNPVETVLNRIRIADETTHGFRATFRDWAGEETETPREVAEMSLAHVVGSKVERSYRRRSALDKRGVLMQAWADFCAGRSGEVVVNFPAGRRNG